MPTDTYESPLADRYASKSMLRLFSQDTRYSTWRRLWVALAEAEMELGLPITQNQIDQMKQHLDDIDYQRVRYYEQQLRHDVMAHIHAYGELCPDARGIIHWGATSCYVTDNADIIIYHSGMRLLYDKLLYLMKLLADFADDHKALPCLGYTHLQSAQPVTVGKRACVWLEDFHADQYDMSSLMADIKLLGSKGTTGTQASFMNLFDNDESKVKRLDEIIARKMGFDSVYPVSGQTYPRKLDMRICNVLAGIAQSAYRFANDMRLLQSMGELEEPFGKKQIGSSAMAYKRNPIRSERICSLARLAMVNALNAPLTASAQWLERTLDDSANRRVCMPEQFLAVDAVLNLCITVADGIVVYPEAIERRLREQLPFMATENILMEAVKAGGDRQQMHEIIRRHAMDARLNMQQTGQPCDLLDRLARDGAFGLDKQSMEGVMQPELYTGRAPSQVREYLRDYIRPIVAGVENKPDAEVLI